MTAVDLFSGGGGAALGLRRAGIRCLAHVEWDKHACATLRAAESASLIDGDVIEGDIRTVVWAPCVGVDLVWASPPCQAWSSAGQRKGAQDDRNGWPWCWDAVDQIRPRWLICENVEGLLDHLSAGHPEGAAGDPGLCSRCYWDLVILPEARRRFAYVGYRVIDCADLGVPQHRRRLILVCGPEPYRWPELTHRDPAMWLARGRPWVTVREALGIELETIAARTPQTAKGANRWHRADECSPTIPAMAGGITCRVVGIKTAHGPGERVADRERVDLTDRPAWTISAHPGSGGGSILVQTHNGERRLALTESMALQSFPPDWPWQGTKTAIYRQIGNAVPPPLAEAIARTLNT